MIYRCENCVNRHNCPENKEQYERTCNTLRDVARGLDKLSEYRSYYSLTIQCDYWVEDKQTLCKVCESPQPKPESTSIDLLPCPICHNVPSVGYLSGMYHLNGDCSFCNDTKFKSIDEVSLKTMWNTQASKIGGQK